MINTSLLKKVLLEQRNNFLSNKNSVPRAQLNGMDKYINTPFAIVISGLRRAGKSTFLRQIANRYYKDKDFYYLHFEDERLLKFNGEDFEAMILTQMELFGECNCFFFDEIQNVQGWEIFIRRLLDQKFKVFITGSNASLLSKELGSRLTGRHTSIELFPFSFEECVLYRGNDLKDFSGVLDTRMEAKLGRHFNKYLEKGGIIEALKYPELNIHETIYNDILYRDIVARFQVDSVKELKELSFYLISNIARPFSFNKLKQLLMLGSVNTVKKFVEYLENSWLFFLVNQYSTSVKVQQQSSKKIYGIDTGLIQSLAFHTGEDHGRYFENIVYLELRKKYKEIFYYKTRSGFEVDFLIRSERILVQACSDLNNNQQTREREIKALKEALEELKWKRGYIFTKNHEEEIYFGNQRISILPLNKWLVAKYFK